MKLLPLLLTLFVPLSHGQPAGPGTEPSPLGTRLLDLDGDGELDMLVHYPDGRLLVRHGVGSRRFLDVVQELPRVAFTDVLCGDLDGDGLPDLYLVSPGADVALVGEGGGHFREATAELGLVESGVGLSVERKDVDGDGLADLLLHNHGSDVLFWARADGRYEREALTVDGDVATASSGLALAAPASADPTGPDGSATPVAPTPVSTQGGQATDPTSGSSTRSTRVPLGASAPSPSASGSGSIAPLGGGSSIINIDQRYVNDNQNEVDSRDIADGSLTGGDVSTSSGDVTFGGGATVTAQQGVFGTSSSASGSDSTVSGGYSNTASNNFSTVSGGIGNTASGGDSTVAGGAYNESSGTSATVSGGGYNNASGLDSTIAGGGFNAASSFYSTVSGGSSNTASGDYSTVAGGRDDTALGAYSFAAGRRAKANHPGAFVWGDSVDADKTSSANDEFDVYAEGGARVFAVGQTTPSFVVDPTGKVGIGTSSPGFALEVNGVARAKRGIFGKNAGASGTYSTVSGGVSNNASGDTSTISGGAANKASNDRSTVGGGYSNTASSLESTVAGGFNNTASGVAATASGGSFSKASATFSTVSGGYDNTASGAGATVCGGGPNTASGDSSIVTGGAYNTAQGDFSFTAGRRAKANHQGAFVWGDSVDKNKSSSANDQFNVYASGGTRIFSNSAATTGVLLAPGGGSWTSVSDRNAKENFQVVDGRDVLERLDAIPISTWNYKAQDDAIRHMGPMAQDFWAAFGLGLGDKSIDTIDPDGVALAAIQGLHALVEEQQARLGEQQQRIEHLQKELEALKAR